MSVIYIVAGWIVLSVILGLAFGRAIAMSHDDEDN